MNTSRFFCLRKACLATSCLVLACNLLAVTPGTTSAQQPPRQPPQFRTPVANQTTAEFRSASHRDSGAQPVNYEAEQIREVLKQGAAFEQQQQWAEALNIYQTALKANPTNVALRERRSVARIHYDLDRRYSDTSFVKTISTSNGTQALNVYAEVLLKIQSYYVDQPNWGRLANYGLTSLEVALSQPSFLKKNLHGKSAADVKQAFNATVKKLNTYPAATRHDVYVIAHAAAREMETRIGLPVQATVYEFVCGAISALDPYSAFMSGNQYGETMSQIEGNFVGLGVELRTHADSLEIVNVIPGGSAHIGGVKSGDHIVAVDNVAVNKAGSERAADMLRGEEGSFVQIAIDRNNTTKSLKLQRRRVEIPSVDQVRIVDNEKGIGYIRLTNFQKNTVRDFDAALWKLHRAGMHSLIVDVRGNPGGLLSSSVEISDRFVDSGVIVSTRGRNPMEDYVHKAKPSNTWRMPLVVLVDENSASASEIFAAAIRDHQRGTIVGHRSYGKGSVQGIFPLNVSGGGVRLTTAKFFSPLGHAISQVGVDADVKVQTTAKSTTDGSNPGSDEGLRIGIQVARRAVAQVEARRNQTFAGR